MNSRSPSAARRTARLCLALALSAPLMLSARSLVEAGAATEWKFLDGTNVPASASGWREAGFNDSAWKSGQAPLGYGEKRLGSTLDAGADATNHPATAWFRREFTNAPLNAGEGLALLLCVDDGAVIYLNGTEIARPNMPAGTIDAHTFARREITDAMEGFYRRIPVPADAWHAGTNVLAVEVHQASAASDDLFFDLALKTVPPAEAAPKVTPAAETVMNSYYKQHYVAPDATIPDGYIDGGRSMKLDS